MVVQFRRDRCRLHILRIGNARCVNFARVRPTFRAGYVFRTACSKKFAGVGAAAEATLARNKGTI